MRQSSGFLVNSWGTFSIVFDFGDGKAEEVRQRILSSRLELQVCSGSETGSYLRLIDSCISQLFKAQGPSRTCNGSTEEEEAYAGVPSSRPASSSRSVL